VLLELLMLMIGDGDDGRWKRRGRVAVVLT